MEFTEPQEKWLSALESKYFDQGVGRLRNRSGKTFCCMGVGCEVSGLGKWDISEYDQGFQYHAGGGPASYTMPGEVSDWLGLSEAAGDFVMTTEVLQVLEDSRPENTTRIYTVDQLTCLSELNDAGWKFSAIAKVIRLRPPRLFKADGSWEGEDV